MNKCAPFLGKVTLWCKVAFMMNATRSFYYNSSSQPHHVYFLSIHLFSSLILNPREIVRNIIRIVQPEVVQHQGNFPEYKAMLHLCESLISKQKGMENAVLLSKSAKTLSMESNWTNYAAMALAFFLPDAIGILEGDDKKEKATISFVSEMLNEDTIPLPLINSLISLNSRTTKPHNLQLEAVVGSKMIELRHEEVRNMERGFHLERERWLKEKEKGEQKSPKDLNFVYEQVVPSAENTPLNFSMVHHQPGHHHPPIYSPWNPEYSFGERSQESKDYQGEDKQQDDNWFDFTKG